MCAQTKQTNQTLNTPVLKNITEADLGITISKEASPKSFAVAVRKLLQNWRQGTLGVKTRSEVSLSGKKPWKQKGTGRARAGNARSPLWRKGGVAFGPQPRTRTLSVPKKVVRGVFASLVSSFAKQGKIHKVNWQLSTEKPKTAEAYTMLKSVGLANKKICLFVPFHDQLTYMSFMNIPAVNLMFFDEPNAVNLANHDWLVLDKDFEAFKQMVAQWI